MRNLMRLWNVSLTTNSAWCICVCLFVRWKAHNFTKLSTADFQLSVSWFNVCIAKLLSPSAETFHWNNWNMQRQNNSNSLHNLIKTARDGFSVVNTEWSYMPSLFSVLNEITEYMSRDITERSKVVWPHAAERISWSQIFILFLVSRRVFTVVGQTSKVTWCLRSDGCYGNSTFTVSEKFACGKFSAKMWPEDHRRHSGTRVEIQNRT